MKTVCITSSESGSGKTTLAKILLRHLNNWAACKVTACLPAELHSCPRKTPCGVCSSLKTNYEIEYKKNIIEKKGTDTYRLSRAGAEKVLWVKAKPDFLAEAIGKVLKKFRKYRGIIFEGNHALKVLNPDLSVMLFPDGSHMKKSARDIMDKIDIFVKDMNDKNIVDKILKRIAYE